MKNYFSEEWEPVNLSGSIGDYAISNLGRVFSFRGDGRYRKVGERGGYLSFRAGYRHHIVHLLVAHTFLPPKPSPRHEINHIDGDKFNNQASNLEWVTPREQRLHSYRLGLQTPRRGQDANCARLKNVQVQCIRALARAGVRQTRLCEWFRHSPATIHRIIKRHTWAAVPAMLFTFAAPALGWHGDTGHPCECYEAVANCGNVDGREKGRDGISASDALTILRYAVGLEETLTCPVYICSGTGEAAMCRRGLGVTSSCPPFDEQPGN